MKLVIQINQPNLITSSIHYNQPNKGLAKKTTGQLVDLANPSVRQLFFQPSVSESIKEVNQFKKEVISIIAATNMQLANQYELKNIKSNQSDPISQSNPNLSNPPTN